MDDLILRAARLAKRAHATQRRKYIAAPYVVHPARVAARAMLLDDVTPAEVAAAWLHDVIEDCGLSPDDLRREGLPEQTVALVVELTNPSRQHPELPRRDRKELDRVRLARASRAARRLKLIDRTDNLLDLRGADEDFRSLYAAESLLLLASLGSDLDAELYEEFDAALATLGYSRQHRDPRAGKLA